MATINHNHVNYDTRIRFAQELLKDHFILNKEPASVVPIGYLENIPFKFNNFVYKVTLASSDYVLHKPLQPGCVEIPDGTSEFVLRLANSEAEGVNSHNRIENDVAATFLMSAALANVGSKVVPSVYAWASATEKGAQGWILQELMSGESLDGEFSDMTLEQKRQILSQVASFMKAIQEYQLPESITGFGGLTFDNHGQIVSAGLTTMDAGPWNTYEDCFRDRFKIALGEVDDNLYIQGWRANGTRERLEAFVENGLTDKFAPLENKDRKVITHGDITASNMLYDRANCRITGLIDYDFAEISHISCEFLESFTRIGGALPGRSGEKSDEETALNHAKLHGFPDPLPPSSDNVDWEVSKIWEEELGRWQVQRPSTIAGIGNIADVNALLKDIKPWRLTNADILVRQSEEAKMMYREKCEQRLVHMLEQLGF